MDWHGLAEEVAWQPGLAERLLARHVSVGGACAGCTQPGTGYPGGVWPCSLHNLGVAALAARDQYQAGLREERENAHAPGPVDDQDVIVWSAEVPE